MFLINTVSGTAPFPQPNRLYQLPYGHIHIIHLPPVYERAELRAVHATVTIKVGLVALDSSEDYLVQPGVGFPSVKYESVQACCEVPVHWVVFIKLGQAVGAAQAHIVPLECGCAA